MLYLVDGNPLLYRAADRVAASVPADSAGGYVVRETLTIVNDMLRRYGDGQVLFVLDGGRGFRKAMYPDYKAHRDAEPDPLREKVRVAARTFESFIGELRGNFVRVPDVEADDILSIVAARSRACGMPTLVVTEDRDLDQTLGGSVRALRLRDEKILTAAEALQAWNGDPVRFAVWKALAGDPGDNIKVFAGIGPERAHELVAFCGVDYGRLFGAEARTLWGKTKWFAKSIGAPDARARMALALRLVVTATDFEHLCPPEFAKTGRWFVPEQVRLAVETSLRRMVSPPLSPDPEALAYARRAYDAHWLPYDLSPLAPFRIAPPGPAALADPFGGQTPQPLRRSVAGAGGPPVPGVGS
jgi:DNA polymerase-1